MILTKTAAATPLPAMVLCLGFFGAAAPAAAQSNDSPYQGFYVGANAGVTWGDSQANTTLVSIPPTGPVVSPPIVPPADVTAINKAAHFDSKHHTGFTGGIEAGYNWVMDSGLLLGVETDLNIYDISAKRSGTIQSPTLINPPTVYTLNQKVDTDFLWTVRPRIGYAMDKVLIFATGGLAITSTQYQANYVDSRTPANTIVIDKKDNGKTGWTIGGGAAYAFTPNISLKGEYLFEDFGHTSISATSTNGLLRYDADVHFKSHLFRAGLDYRF